MNPNPDDQQFRDFFDEMKRADDRRAPSFEQDWAAAGSKAGSPDSILAGLRYGRVIGLLAVGMMLAIAAGVLSHQRANEPSMAIKLSPAVKTNGDLGGAQPATPLDQWQSPTAFLLQNPDEWGQPAQFENSNLRFQMNDEPASAFPSTRPQGRHST